MERRVARENITALDLETRTSLSDLLAGKLERGRDFLQWAQESSERFDRIIANPPYVALSKVPAPLRKRALSVLDPDGQPVRLGANYWSAFVCASPKLLKPGGSMGFILPAAWDYADYAEPLRQGLKKWFPIVEVHRCLEPMFRPVNDGCVVLIARYYETGSRPGQVFRYEYPTLDELVATLSASKARREQIRHHSDGTRLSEILEIRLGGVTGDAKYFLLSNDERKQHRLDEDTCVRVVSKARHLKKGHITLKQWERLKDDGERVWLFRPDKSMENRASVRTYLQLPIDQGGCHRDRFKIKDRVPWYQTPMPDKVHGFISGMSRFGAWICLNRMDNLNATNTLYVVRFLKASQKKDEQAAWAMALLTTRVRKAVHGIRRRYPDGLSKIEPGDLAEIRVPTPRKVNGALDAYLEATEHLLAEREDQATRIADAWFE
ncbi:Eco57I restriction-modification methylase domain-containing protein [Archangium lansingense]|uniref:Eco57I restriction-modification methylase domain-containing protein n=1 Tax=Archangium lansingense TaxID=2995310 RepID=UPI003B7AF880